MLEAMENTKKKLIQLLVSTAIAPFGVCSIRKEQLEKNISSGLPYQQNVAIIFWSILSC